MIVRSVLGNIEPSELGACDAHVDAGGCAVVGKHSTRRRARPRRRGEVVKLLMIDYERAVYDFAERIFHAHAKDLEVRPDGLYRHGTLSSGIGWQVPRIPGLGEVDWSRFVAALYAVGYDHVLSVEHEDRRFEGTQELVERGFLIARNTLAPLLI